jgi:FKBP-type peptidyl-prolyl cis-trans isomerase FkpA
MQKLLFLCCLVVAIFTTNCKDKQLPYAEQLAVDIEKLDSYAAAKGWTTIKTDSGLRYLITEEGSGDKPTVNSTVTVNYKGYTLNDVVFDETTSGPVTFELVRLIPAWQEGIPLSKKEGKITLLCPSGLAYGSKGSGSIEPNEPLIFEIEVVDFY